MIYVSVYIVYFIIYIYNSHLTLGNKSVSDSDSDYECSKVVVISYPVAPSRTDVPLVPWREISLSLWMLVSAAQTQTHKSHKHTIKWQHYTWIFTVDMNVNMA